MIKIREATESDNPGLINLTSLTPMKGEISIRIDRHPDFFRLLRLRGTCIVYVMEKDQEIIGSFSAAEVKCFINGKESIVHYIGDLKIHPTIQKTVYTVRLIYVLYDHLLKKGADIVFCTVANGNDEVLPFFNGRAGLPIFKNIGIFTVFQMIPFPQAGINDHYHIEQTTVDNDLLSLYNEYSKNYQFGHLLDKCSLDSAINYSIKLDGDYKAAISLVDVGDAKQNVIIKLPTPIRIIVNFINSISRIVPFFHLPRPNEPIKILYVKAFAWKDDYKDAFKILIKKAMETAYRRNYSFLSIGLHEKDSLQKSFSRKMKFTFKSIGLITSLKGNTGTIEDIINGIPFEDYSLV